MQNKLFLAQPHHPTFALLQHSMYTVLKFISNVPVFRNAK